MKHAPPTDARRRNRWKHALPESTASPSCGVEPAPTSPNSQDSHEEQEAPHKVAPQRRVRKSPLKLSAVKSKAVKPHPPAQRGARRLPSIPELGPPQEPPYLQACGHTGLANLEADRMKEEVAANPNMPEPDASCNSSDNPANRVETTAEIYLQEESEQAGTVDTDLALQSEQRAMQELYRFQKLSLQALDQPDASLPAPPPTNLYAVLPKEWPLARMSVSMRHVSVLLRVTLLRRLAELSFRGIAFTELPREVVREVHHDFDGVCGAVANQLASLFAFLRPDQPQSAHRLLS